MPMFHDIRFDNLIIYNFFSWSVLSNYPTIPFLIACAMVMDRLNFFLEICAKIDEHFFFPRTIHYMSYMKNDNNFADTVNMAGFVSIKSKRPKLTINSYSLVSFNL